MKIDRVLESCLYVDDLDRAAHFYQEVLGLAPFDRTDGRHLFLTCGTSMVLLFIADATMKSTGLPVHGSIGAGHLAFAVPQEQLESLKAHLTRHDIPIEREIEWPNGARSIYVRDPAGNSVEFAPPCLWELT